MLLLAPDSPAAARAGEIGESVDGFIAGIRMSIARLQELSDVANGLVWLFEALPIWRLFGFDHDRPVNVASAFYRIVTTVKSQTSDGLADLRRVLGGSLDEIKRSTHGGQR